MRTTPRGRFCWYELLTTDPDAAATFYTGITGWAVDTWEGGETPYRMWVNGGQALGGVMELPPEARQAGTPPHWLAYVSTPDLDRTLDRAAREGASTVWGPVEVEGVGRMAGIQDPQGAMVAAYQPADETPGHDGPARVGEFSWHELATTDREGAWSFYTGLFGWTETDRMDMGEMGIYQMFGRGERPLGGIFSKPPEIPVPNWLLYVRVPDVDRAVKDVDARGGRLLNGPMEVPGGDRVAQCMDPQGAAFALHSTAV